jgi:hypothetical protein
MPETGTSGSMSGDGKRSDGQRPQATAPILDSTEASLSVAQRHVGNWGKVEVVYTRSKLRSRPLADMLHDPPFGKDGCYTLSARSSPVMVSNLVMRMTKASLG